MFHRLRAPDLDVAAHRRGAQLDVRTALAGLVAPDVEIRRRLAAHRLRIDPEAHALGDADLDVSGGRLQRDLTRDDASDLLVAGRGLDGQRRVRHVDRDVARCGADLPAALQRANLDVSRGGVHGRVSADPGQVHVAAGGVDAHVTVDVVEAGVAGCGVDLDGAVAPARLHVCRAGRELDVCAVRGANVEPVLRPPREQAKPLRCLDHDLETVPAPPQLDRRRGERLFVTRVELDVGLRVVAGLEPDLPGRN